MNSKQTKMRHYKMLMSEMCLRWKQQKKIQEEGFVCRLLENMEYLHSFHD